MGEFSVWHWMIVLLVVMLVFGGSRVSSVMGDVAKGIREFKKNLSEPAERAAEESADEEPKQLSSKQRSAESPSREKAAVRRA